MLEKLTRFETSEQTTPGTHYYRNMYQQVKDAVHANAKKMGYTVKSTNDDHKEMLLKKGSIEIMVTCFSITMMETAVDLMVISGVFTPGKKIAAAFYQNLNGQLSLK